ncbi:hypothetical protein [Saccharopolyspora shandongensis]|uniref:hypothetical protein n=1 Tax=Saccharopolyspora shandongensis TaxID=418495 RepID=UPI0033EB3DB6
MGTIEALIPAARQANTADLLEVDADELARYVADTANPWWRREPCAAALAGRVPEAHVPKLLAHIRDLDETAGVRIALLDILGYREELLPWLQHEDRKADNSYGVPEAILKARGMVGDRTATCELTTLANSPWPHRSAVGEAGLEALIARYGTEEVLSQLDDARPDDRAFCVRLRHRAGEDVTEALADPDVGVACLAHSLVDDEEALRRYLEHAPTADAKLWAACALYRLNNNLSEIQEIYDSLGRPRVEIDGLDEEIRSAIRGEYAPGCQARTDPRWRVEAICAEPVQPPDEYDQLRRAITALESANPAPHRPILCGTGYSEGDGTYNEIRHGGTTVRVSTLGRFVTGNEDVAVRGALEAAGFRWIDRTLGSIKVTGLCVYFFGDREPLDVYDLLFYWQD